VTAREWAPGDVALARINKWTGRVFFSGDTWVTDDDEGDWPTEALDEARRLVVLDLEFPATVVKHLRMAAENDAALSTLSWLADRIAEQTAPTEPTDPRARVTDRRENIWRLLADGDWVCTSGPDIGEYLVWSRLAAGRGPVSIEVIS
jgi:hypothetical protein